MHKNRLQELCQKRMWALPAYNSNRDGPDHNPRFSASVVVNGDTFDAPSLSKSVKEAHNKAAEVALDSISAILTAAPSTPAADAPATSATGGLGYLSFSCLGILHCFNVLQLLCFEVGIVAWKSYLGYLLNLPKDLASAIKEML